MKKKIATADIVWGGGIVALALGATVARSLGYLEGDTPTRVVLGVTGLMLAWYGNRMPKAFAPTASAARVQRVGGWSMALSGLVYAGVWAFAPMTTAFIVGCGAVLAGVAVTVGYCLALRTREKPA